MRSLFPYFKLLKPVRLQFIVALICGIIYGVSSGFGLPFVASKIFPVLFGDEGTQDLILGGTLMGIHFPQITIPQDYVLIFTITLLPLTFLIRAISGFLNSYYINLSGICVLEQIRIQIFSKLQQLPLSFYNQHKSGDLQARVLADTSAIQMVMVNVSNDIIKQPISFIGAMGALIYLAFQKQEIVFILMALSIVPLCVAPIRMIAKRLLKRSTQMNELNGLITAQVSEALQAPREIRAYGLQDKQIKSFSQRIHDFFRLQLKIVKYRSLLNPSIEVVTVIGVSISIYYASKSGLGLDDVLPLIMALYLSYEPIKKIGKINNSLQTAIAAISRIEYILNQKDTLPDPEEPEALEETQGYMVFNNVTFAYNETPVLKDISITINPGEIIALVGPSGAGKSTFANMILRFYDPSIGSVTIDGKDLRNVKKADLRQHISFVSQETILFNDNVFNNILIGKPNASREEVMEAAKKAMAHDFITTLEQGYETMIGERGTRLSGGQKQRISIARAFLKDAPILVLDEATSALDTESETKIQKALEILVQGKTTFVIAHRFSTIKFATRILVFDQGRIIADGPHDKIYEQCLLYKNLYNKQLGH